MKITKSLTNYKVTRTRIITQKEVATTYKLGKNPSDVKEQLEDKDVRYGYEDINQSGVSTGSREVLNIEEEINIEETK